MTTPSPMITPSPAALLRLDPRDRAGLEWVKNRARFWLTGLKRRRKYLPLGEPYSEAEAAAIRALIALEDAAGELLKNHLRQGWASADPGGLLVTRRPLSCCDPSSAD